MTCIHKSRSDLDINAIIVSEDEHYSTIIELFDVCDVTIIDASFDGIHVKESIPLPDDVCSHWNEAAKLGVAAGAGSLLLLCVAVAMIKSVARSPMCIVAMAIAIAGSVLAKMVRLNPNQPIASSTIRLPST